MVKAGTKFKSWGRVSSLSDYLKRVLIEKQREAAQGNKADFIFRGHRSVGWKVEAKAARTTWKGEPLKLERLALDEFARTTPRFPFLNTDNDWDRIAIAQHHGLPTRFMDWTYSALAALWFAIESGPLNPSPAKPRKRAAEESSFRKNDAAVWILKPLTADYIKSSACTTPFDNDRSWVFRPRIIADRIQAQSGVFVVHAAINGRFIPLEKNSNFITKLIRVPIAVESFESLRQELHICGINHSSMFPDLDGLCKHVTWRYTR